MLPPNVGQVAYLSNSSPNVGQVAYLSIQLRIPASPTSRPRKILGFVHNSGPNRIEINVPRNTLELGFISDESIKALVLPKRLTSKIEQSVGFQSRVSLKRLHDSRHANCRADQKMHMVSHHHIGMEPVFGGMTVLDRFLDQARQLGILQMEGTRTSTIELLVDFHKFPPGLNCLSQSVSNWEASVESPCYEHGLADCIEVGEMPAREGAHIDAVANRTLKSLKFWTGMHPVLHCFWTGVRPVLHGND